MNSNILPADTFVVINKTILSEYDRRILTMLYQPIVGSNVINLYFTFWAYLDKSDLFSKEWTHHHLMINMRTKIENINQAREKLEGIGLLKTYYKEGNINNYVYELYSPLSASEFINNPILNTTLYNNVGDNEFNKIIEYFKIPKIDLKDYTELTKKFSDVFESANINNFETIDSDLKKIVKNDIDVQAKINLDNILDLIPNEMLNKRSITRPVKNLIYKLSFVYDYTEEQIVYLLRNSINEKHRIDKKSLLQGAKKYYQFENNGNLPTLIYRSQPEYLRKPTGDDSKKAKVIYQFETTSPYDFLYSKNNGNKPTKKDIELLEYLVVDLDLKPGVVNVLIDYVLKINNNKLVKAYVEQIASQWVRSKVETVEDAMALAIKEYKARRRKTTTKKKYEENKPEWFDKDIKKKQASDEEMKMMRDLLSDID